MLEHERPATEEVVNHIDRCLSCLACMTTCPSGVHYMHLVDHARDHIEQTYRRPLADRLLRDVLADVLPDPRRFCAGAASRRCSPSRWRRCSTRIGLKPLAAMLRLAPARWPRRPPDGRGSSGAGRAPGPRRAAVRLRQRRCWRRRLNEAADPRAHPPRHRGGAGGRARAAAARSSITWAASTRRSRRRAPISMPGLREIDEPAGSTPSWSPRRAAARRSRTTASCCATTRPMRDAPRAVSALAHGCLRISRRPRRCGRTTAATGLARRLSRGLLAAARSENHARAEGAAFAGWASWSRTCRKVICAAARPVPTTFCSRTSRRGCATRKVGNIERLRPM